MRNSSVRFVCQQVLEVDGEYAACLYEILVSEEGDCRHVPKWQYGIAHAGGMFHVHSHIFPPLVHRSRLSVDHQAGSVAGRPRNRRLVWLELRERRERNSLHRQRDVGRVRELHGGVSSSNPEKGVPTDLQAGPLAEVNRLGS